MQKKEALWITAYHKLISQQPRVLITNRQRTQILPCLDGPTFQSPYPISLLLSPILTQWILKSLERLKFRFKNMILFNCISCKLYISFFNQGISFCHRFQNTSTAMRKSEFLLNMASSWLAQKIQTIKGSCRRRIVAMILMDVSAKLKL